MDHLFSFKGRDTKSDWWDVQFIQYPLFILTIGIFLLGIYEIDTAAMTRITDSEDGGTYLGLLKILWLMQLKYLIPFVILTVISTWIMITSNVRRLHDFDRSGFWYFLTFVPFLGLILEFTLAFLHGSSSNNKYGVSSLDGGSSSFDPQRMDDLIYERHASGGGYVAKASSPASQKSEPQPSKPQNFKYMKDDKPKPMFGG